MPNREVKMFPLSLFFTQITSASQEDLQPVWSGQEFLASEVKGPHLESRPTAKFLASCLFELPVSEDPGFSCTSSIQGEQTSAGPDLNGCDMQSVTHGLHEH